ncbi:hypothetical protein R4K48_11085 [Brachyspira pulli]
MANFVNYNFYFFTDKDYALLLKEYNEIIQKSFKSEAGNKNISTS